MSNPSHDPEGLPAGRGAPGMFELHDETMRNQRTHTRFEQYRADAHVGDTVVTSDGVLGRVDSVIRSERANPAYLVVAAGRLFRRRYPVIPWALVKNVDRSHRRIHLEGRRDRLGRLSESVPIVL